MGKSFFITGTDTDIGKTVVATLLARKLSAKYLKPLQCGGLNASDSQFASQWLKPESVLAEIYRFESPLSPHQAAACENRTIDFDLLCNKARAAILAQEGPMVIEGAGGLLVPLDETHFIIDLIAKLEIETVLVARTSLGTLNHTLLSLEALHARRILVRGVVLVGEENIENARSIGKYGHVKILGRVPMTKTFSAEWMDQTARHLSIGDPE